MPHVVAITRAPRADVPGTYREIGGTSAAPIDAWLVPVATTLAMTPYDLRLRLAGPAPWVTARVSSEAEASASVSRLRDLGCGAVHLDPADTTLRGATFVARAFARPSSLRLEPENREVEYGDITLVVRATLEEELGREVTRFSPSTFDGVTSHSRERARKHAVYVLSARGAPVRLVEGLFGLPEEQGATTRAKLDSFVEKVRAHAPSARFHDAFVSEPRKRTSMRALSQSDTHRSTVQGNVEETDLAVALLARALAEGQA